MGTHVEPEVEVLAEVALPHLGQEVLVGGGHHPDVDVQDPLAAHPGISPAWRARSTLAWAERLMSPISSRNRVPPWATSNWPRRRAAAPEKLPFSWPNSSDSMRLRGDGGAVHLDEGGLGPLGLPVQAAMSSLPVPDSPRTSTRPLVGATLAISSRSRCMEALSPSISSSKRRSRAERAWTFSSRVRLERAFFTETSTRSRSTGFPKKSLAPRFMASTTSAVSAWPENHNHRQVAPQLARPGEEAQAVHPREPDVEDGEVDRLGLEELERLLGALGLLDLVLLRLQHHAEGAPDVLLVVDHEQEGFAGVHKGRGV